MPRPRPQSQSVSLFPFLAVLVCAMGALILLLIVTTRRIRREALVKAAVKAAPPRPILKALPIPVPPPPKPAPPKPNPIQPTLPALPALADGSNDTDRIMAAHVAKIRDTQIERQSEIARLRAQRTAAKKSLDKLKSAIAVAQRDLKSARDQLRRIESRASQLAGAMNTDRQSAVKFKQQAADLEGRIAVLRRNIANLKQQQAQASSRFAIVPFDGSRGTTRRPIYIECTKDSLRILPEDIAISASDLQHFAADYNPLLAGTQALVHFWEARSRLDGDGKEPAPYVLLLVRPGGTMAYYAARKMLRNFKGPSGYELIEDDWKLAMPQPHPKAKAVCRIAVDRALAARNETLRSMAGQGGGYGAGGKTGRSMRFNRATGRFEVVKPVDEVMGKRKPLKTGFGKIVRAPDSETGHIRRPSSTGNGSSGGPLIRPSVTTIRPGTRRGNRPTGTAQSGQSQSTQNIAANGNAPRPLPNNAAGRKSNGDATGSAITPRQRANHPLWPLTAKRNTPRPKINGRPAGSNNDPGEQSNGSQGADPKPGDKSGQPGGRYVGSGTPGGGGGPNNLHGMSKTTVGGGDGRGTAGGRQSTRRIRWGLSDPDATIGFEKDVRIWCTADRVVIGSRQVIRVDKGLDRDELFRRVVFAVEAEARSWGKPPKGFYWIPSPQFTISPGGNRHYERVNGGLKRLGLQTSAQYRLDSTPPATVNGGRHVP